MSMLHAITKRPLTLSEGRAGLIEKRTPKKPKPSEPNPITVKDFKFFKKGEHAWKLDELSKDLSFCTLNLGRQEKLVRTTLKISQNPSSTKTVLKKFNFRSTFSLIFTLKSLLQLSMSIT